MCKVILAAVAICIISTANSDIAEQDDWIGGSGVWGPVTEWDNTFYTSEGINWSIPEVITLMTDSNGQYVSDGFLESSWLYTGDDPDWSWAGIMRTVYGPGLVTALQVRTTDDMGILPEWSDTVFIEDTFFFMLDTVLTDSDSYFQYRIILQTSNPQWSAVISTFTVTWNSLGIDEPDLEGFSLLQIKPNPAICPVEIGFSVPEPSHVDISVFDIAGHLIRKSSIELSTGFHDMVVSGLDPGIYYCRMITDNFTATQQFVVIE